MSSYGNYVTKLAINMQSSNMQRHMGENSTYGLTSEREKILDNISKYIFKVFVDSIYRKITNQKIEEDSENFLVEYFNDNERDLLPVFSKINEDCLNDPEFSKAIVKQLPYMKKIDTVKDNVMFYVPSRVDSVSHETKMDLLFLPSISNIDNNKFRLEFYERLSNTSFYPYIKFSIDFTDDKEIIFNKPEIIDLDNRLDMNSIKKIPATMSDTHIKIDDDLKPISDCFMNVFSKCGIIEDENLINK